MNLTDFPLDLLGDLADPKWRLRNLYTIVDRDANVIPFRPNDTQNDFLDNLHYRNLILKARQRGLSTLVQLMGLDQALFNDNFSAGIIADNLDNAAIFLKRIEFAYNHLPAAIRDAVRIKSRNTSLIEFSNGSSIRVDTSYRSGSLQFLHVSEFGKICAKSPDKATEIMTGTLPALAPGGFAVIESTAEGNDGYFFRLSKDAENKKKLGTPLTKIDFKFHFYSWWDEDQYQIDPSTIVLTHDEALYCHEIEAKIGRKLEPSRWAWYWATRRTLGDKMLQEHPSCVAGHVRVGTPGGMVKIAEVEPDGETVLAHFDKGERPVFDVVTKLGYTVTCTADHPVKLADGTFLKIEEGLAPGHRVRLGAPSFGSKQQWVPWSPVPFVAGRIDIDENFAEFLGMFMGDGSFHDGTVSVACDAQDIDTVAHVEGMFERYLGGSGSRLTGAKKGCLEIRKAGKVFEGPLLALGVVEHRPSGGLKRKVHVPDYIFRSPKNVVAAFLRGLFEADGFANREGNRVSFFSKHRHVVQDVQMLLLAFGIESRIATLTKKSGCGTYTYTGSELNIRANGVRTYAADIGFISARKSERLALAFSKKHTNPPKAFDFTDEIVSVTPAGVARVYDITTASHEFDAGGIVVHNCPEEAFWASAEGRYYTAQMTKVRNERRISLFPHDPRYPVHTFWDIGQGDETAVWCMQFAGQRFRWLRYFEASGEPFAKFINDLTETGYLWDTHWLPHDATHKRQLGLVNMSALDMLEELAPGWHFEVVDRIPDITVGIQQVRQMLDLSEFDEAGCAVGIQHLDNYRKEWNERTGAWKANPFHDSASNSADSIRQCAQAWSAGLLSIPAPVREITRRGTQNRNWRTV